MPHPTEVTRTNYSGPDRTANLPDGDLRKSSLTSRAAVGLKRKEGSYMGNGVESAVDPAVAASPLGHGLARYARQPLLLYLHVARYPLEEGQRRVLGLAVSSLGPGRFLG